MIKTVDQAVQVQLRRVAAGKKGRAAAGRAMSELLCAKRGLIGIAARLAMCKALYELEEVCENQSRISTDRLRDIVDRASNKLKYEAACIRNLTNKIST